MEITSSNTLFPYSKTTCSSSSPPQQNHANKEFEFQMSSSLLASDKDSQITTTYFPADELFYKGKLLPLHLPPRLQMVQNILKNSNKFTAIKLSEEEEEDFDFEEETFTIPFMSLTAPCTNTSTPIDQSCNISPSESCRVSCEFLSDDREEYLSEDQYWSSRVRSVLIGGPTSNGRSSSSKKSLSSWSTKLRQSSLGKRLVKASRAYLKSLFLHKPPACSDGSTSAKTLATQTCNVGHEENYARLSKTSTSGWRRMVVNRNSKMISATSLMKSIENEIMAENITTHRKSFSGVIQKHNSGNNKSLLFNSTSSSGSSSSSSSFSLSSNGTSSSSSSSSSSYDLQWLKRCSSASLELESSIEGAIAHCKQSLISQQFFSSRSKSTTTSTGQVGYLPNFSLAASRIAV